ncbi:hypothetical protein ACFQYP_25290 [Nonomuraea antimicrobica]
MRATGGLSADDLAEAWESLLFRAERKLVRAGLSWLRASVRRSPELADAVAAPLARAFAADSAELQEMAVEVALAHVGGMGEESRAVIREAVELLPPGLGRQAALAFDGARWPTPRPRTYHRHSRPPPNAPAPSNPLPAPRRSWPG